MVFQVLTKGLLLFNLSHPAHNICKEIFFEILICFKCYQIEDHPTSSCPKSKDYKICSLCASLEHTHRECTSSNRKCVNCEEDNDHNTLAMSCHVWKKVSNKKRLEIIQSINIPHYISYQASHFHSRPALSISQVLAHSNSAGHSSLITSVKTNGGPDNITIPIQSIPTFGKSSVSNAVISVLTATAKNCDEPGTFETVLNSLLTANGLPTFKMGNVTPPTSFQPIPTDISSLNTESTFTPSLRGKPSTASSEDLHSASKVTAFKKKQTKKPTKENISELLSGNKLILKTPLEDR